MDAQRVGHHGKRGEDQQPSGFYRRSTQIEGSLENYGNHDGFGHQQHVFEPGQGTVSNVDAGE